MSSYVPPSIYQYPMLPHQGPSTNNGGHNAHWGPEQEQALIHYASQTSAGDIRNTGVVADTQANVLRCMLSTVVSQFGEHIIPCGHAFTDLDDLMTHARDEHGLQGFYRKRIDCLWLVSGIHLCGENIGGSGYKRHIAAHLGLRVVCKECSQSFCRKDYLMKHLGLRVVCKECSQSFCRKDYLKKHLKDQH